MAMCGCHAHLYIFLGILRGIELFFRPKRPENGHDIRFVSNLRMEPKFRHAKRAILLKRSEVVGMHHVFSTLGMVKHQVGQGNRTFSGLFWHEMLETKCRLAQLARDHGQG